MSTVFHIQCTVQVSKQCYGGVVLVKLKRFLTEKHNHFQALYIDAAKHAPQELHQVQDLIIEKELRLHVTPEELDVLRV